MMMMMVVQITSHAGTVVPECFKDDNASQWKSGITDINEDWLTD